MSEANTPADILLQKAEGLVTEALELMRRKNHDYTSGSGDPYANFRTAASFGVHPAVGIVIRIGDKLQRIRTFAERGQLQVDGEGLRDACLDVINYAVLAYGLLTEGADDDALLAFEQALQDGVKSPFDVLKAEQPVNPPRKR